MAKKFSRIMVEINEKMLVNITDLPQKEYEEFLELIHGVRTAYIVAMDKRNETN